MNEGTKQARPRQRVSRIRLFLWRSFSRFFAQERLRDLYAGLLAREPDPDGEAVYVAALKRRGSTTPVITSLVHSDEFQRKSVAFLAPGLVRALYRGILGREADAEGLEAHTHQLSEGADLEAVSASLLNSDEFRKMRIASLSPDIVNAAYKGILQRDADPDGFNAHMVLLNNSHDIAALLNGMIESDEFRLKTKAFPPGINNGAIDEQNIPQPEGAQIEGGAGALTPETRQTLQELRNQIEETKHRHERYLTLQAASIRELTSHAATLSNRRASVPDSLLKLSIIMPVFNRPHLVLEAIGSVLQQSYPNRELIVVDDGSDLPFPADAWARVLADPCVKYLRIAHGGAPRARNAGIEAATGDVIVYLDSDNIMYPDYLGAVAGAFEAHAEMMCAHAAMLWDDGALLAHLQHDSFDWTRLSENKIGIDMNAFAHRRELYQKLGGFDESLLRHADFDLILRYTREHPSVSIPAIGVLYRFGSWPCITFQEASEPGLHRIAAKHLPPIADPPRVLVVAYDYPQLSESYVDTEIRWMLSRGVTIEAFVCTEPGSPGKPMVKIHCGNLQEAIQAFQPDIIHVHWLSMFTHWEKDLGQSDIPVTIRSHGFDLGREIVAKCGAAPAVRSIYMYPFQCKVYAQETSKMRPVAASFDTSRFYPRLERDPRLVLRAGACLPTKDLDGFIRIAALRPEYKFVLVLARVTSCPTLPEELMALNKSLGSPVEFRLGMQYPEMAELTASAGIYLHTFGFKQEFGMPISIAEAMGCGAVPLVRDCDAARAYAGTAAEYYQTPEDAAAILKEMLDWSPEQWKERSSRSAQHAYRNYADGLVLPDILADWQAIKTDRSRVASRLES